MTKTKKIPIRLGEHSFKLTLPEGLAEKFLDLELESEASRATLTKIAFEFMLKVSPKYGKILKGNEKINPYEGAKILKKKADFETATDCLVHSIRLYLEGIKIGLIDPPRREGRKIITGLPEGDIPAKDILRFRRPRRRPKLLLRTRS